MHSKSLPMLLKMEAYEGLSLAESARLCYALEDEMILTPVGLLASSYQPHLVYA